MLSLKKTTTIWRVLFAATLFAALLVPTDSASASPHATTGELMAECNWDVLYEVREDPETSGNDWIDSGMEDTRSRNKYELDDSSLNLFCSGYPELTGEWDTRGYGYTDDGQHSGLGENCTDGGTEQEVQSDGSLDVHSGVLDLYGPRPLSGELHFTRIGTTVLADGPLYDSYTLPSAPKPEPDYWFQAQLEMTPHSNGWGTGGDCFSDNVKWWDWFGTVQIYGGDRGDLNAPMTHHCIAEDDPDAAHCDDIEDDVNDAIGQLPDPEEEAGKIQQQVQEEAGKIEQEVRDLIDQLPDPFQVVGDVLDIVGGLIPDPPELPEGHPSQACTGGEVVADGFAGDTYIKLRGDQNGDETRLCFRADNDQSGFGGRVDITDPQGAGAVGTTNGFACTSTPVLDGELGDPADPATYVPYTVAVDDASDETVLCVRAGDFERTITTSTSPDAVFEVLLDSPSTYATMSDWPAVPSAACADQGGDRHVDVESFGTRVRLASYSSGTGQAQVCVRADGPVPVGGVLTVDTSGAPGVEPVIETGSDRTACTLNVLSNSQPATVEISRSPTGDIPASVCVRAEGTVLRVTVGVEGDPTLPSVTWTPDPNTPG